MMAEGWISIHRKVLECSIWDSNEPYDRRSAWIYLLLRCNHKNKQTVFNGKMITVGKGQFLTSIRQLSSTWKWGINKTVSFLNMLEEAEMITRDSTKGRTLLTIVKYEFYQGERNTDGTQAERIYTEIDGKKELKNGTPQTLDITEVKAVERNTDGTQTERRQIHGQITNNKLNKDISKDISKNNRTFKPPTVEEVRAYCLERNNDVDAEYFIDYYQVRDWKVGKNKMKDWKAAVRTWERNGFNNGRKRDNNSKISTTHYSELDSLAQYYGNKQ